MFRLIPLNSHHLLLLLRVSKHHQTLKVKLLMIIFLYFQFSNKHTIMTFPVLTLILKATQINYKYFNIDIDTADI